MPRTAAALVLTLLLATAPATAQDGEGEPPEVPPPPPEELTRGEPIEPAVEIISRPWAEIREYSINGQVYAVRIDPRGAPAYYLYDSDGDGQLDNRHPTNLDAPDIHQWELFRW
ncbi:DUF2782 domain-containing protein [Arhodomonas sp. SL1]|uniref:DUF2782 domain-containing protein n=1 Tax=Arhodomonas sp. SL1 TaxID=3425691 RepID=UPI003F8806EA